MKVCIQDSSEGPGNRVETIVEMPQCPAVGETVFLSDDHGGMTVKAVLWTPYQKDYDVQVRGW